MKSASPPSKGNSGHLHDVPFHQKSDSLYRSVAEFLLDGLASDESALVIATAQHRERILKHLTALSFDVACLRLGSALFLLNPNETLSEFMTDRGLDAARFVDITVTAAEKVCRGGPRDLAIRIYSELTDESNGQSASPVEVMWYRLAATPDVIFLSDHAIGYRREDTAGYDVWRQRGRVISRLKRFDHPGEPGVRLRRLNSAEVAHGSSTRHDALRT